MRRVLEFVLVIAGLAFLSKAGWEMYRYWWFQGQPLSNDLKAARLLPVRDAALHPVSRPAIGQINIPRLQMSVPMLEGDDEDTLSIAAGHITGTAPIGSSGNAVIAGHRDTTFWPLRNIKPGDLVTVKTDRRYTYAVQNIRIVSSEDTSVLEDTRNAILTMVTCYPFRHIGPAPKRFIVVAKLLNSSQ